MVDLYNNLLGPLDKNACFYFLIITTIFLLILFLMFISELIFLIQHYKTIKGKNILNGLLVLFNIFIAYFVNRLLYTMCNKSLA
jgi:hypothetical protein